MATNYVDHMNRKRAYLLYLQCIDFPSLSQSRVVASRFSRVFSVLASVIHSRYSFLCELLKPSKALLASGFLESASAKYWGTSSTVADAELFAAGNFTPVSLRRIAFL